MTALQTTGAPSSPAITLVRQIEAAGLTTVTLGERVVVMPFGGRVIGLFPRPEFNALWTNPLLHDPARLAGILNQPDWLNLGGDRTWISPEVETNIGDPNRMNATYAVPKAIDPGAYSVTDRRLDSISLTNQLTAQFLRSSKRLDLKVTKQIRLLKRPPVPFDRLHDAIGYEQRTRLEAPSLPAGIHPAIWNLLQVPGGGVILVPSITAVEPRTFFGSPVWNRQGSAIAVPVRTAVSFKLGIHAGQSRGQILFTGQTSGNRYLVLRRFQVSAAEQYYDVPCDDLSARGYMTQVYVDDGALGGFGEMEYHSPALDRNANRTSIEDVCQTWAFTGTAQEIEAVTAAASG